MAIRQLCACMCIMFFLLAVAFAAAQAPAPAPPDPVASPDPFHDPADMPYSGDPGAAGRIQHAHEICYNTVMHVPRKCARQFIRAMFTGRTVTTFPITPYCCHQLACVREWTCADVLRSVCLPPGKDVCPPPPVMARQSTATAHGD